MLLLREEGREDIGLPASVARLAVGDAAQAVGEGCAGFDEGVAGGGDAADRADEVDAEVGGCGHGWKLVVGKCWDFEETRDLTSYFIENLLIGML